MHTHIHDRPVQRVIGVHAVLEAEGLHYLFNDLMSVHSQPNIPFVHRHFQYVIFRFLPTLLTRHRTPTALHCQRNLHPA